MANFKENKKYHYTYKTANLINGRYYLGMHSTNRLNDKYIGSGKRLYYEVGKYGRENFKFEILEQFNSREELVQAEIDLITKQDLENPNCLNCRPGGTGGYSDIKHVESRQKARAEGHRRYFDSIKSNPDLYKEHSQKISKVKKGQEGTFKGRHHSEETKKRMSESKKNSSKGVGNSQYGTCWITNEIESKKIYKSDLIPEGWRLGRKIKSGT